MLSYTLDSMIQEAEGHWHTADQGNQSGEMGYWNGFYQALKVVKELLKADNQEGIE